MSLATLVRSSCANYEPPSGCLFHRLGCVVLSEKPCPYFKSCIVPLGTPDERERYKALEAAKVPANRHGSIAPRAASELSGVISTKVALAERQRNGA